MAKCRTDRIRVQGHRKSRVAHSPLNRDHNRGIIDERWRNCCVRLSNFVVRLPPSQGTFVEGARRVSSTLLDHCGAGPLNAAELARIAPPAPTRTWYPLAYARNGGCFGLRRPGRRRICDLSMPLGRVARRLPVLLNVGLTTGISTNRSPAVGKPLRLTVVVMRSRTRSKELCRKPQDTWRSA